jgi:hypothetical protein
MLPVFGTRLKRPQLVQLLYKELLGRSARPEEMDEALRLLWRTRLSEAAAALMERLFDEEEASAKLGPRLLAKPRTHDEETNEAIEFVVSLGTHCFTSSMLQRLRLRPFAGPFDWLFTNIGMIAHCVQDDFKVFLDPKFFEVVPSSQRPDPKENLCEHSYYRTEFGQRFVFNHTDPTTTEGFAYLTRCVQRMRAVLASPARKLFVCVLGRPAYSPEAFRELVNALTTRSNQLALLCLVVEQTAPGATMPEIELKEKAPPYEVFSITPVSTLGGTRFADPIDEVVIARIVCRKKFNLSQI